VSLIYVVQTTNLSLKKDNNLKSLLIIVLLSQKLLKFMKENGRLQKSMEKVENNLLMVIPIRDFMPKVFFMEKELILGEMVLFIKDHF